MGIGGDRSTFVCYCRGEGYSPGVYVWHPIPVARILQDACFRMRRHGAAHSAARLCGFLNTVFPGYLGISLDPPPRILETGIPDWENYPADSSGNLYLIDVDIAVAVCLRGYRRKGRIIRLRAMASEGISYGTTCEKYMAEEKERNDRYRRTRGLPALKTPNVLSGKKVY